MNSRSSCVEVKSMLKKTISATFLVAVSMLLPAIAGAEVPDWLRALAKQPAKTYADDIEAVILLDDQTTTVKEGGEIIHHRRIAWKVLRPEVRDQLATFPVGYDSDSSVNYLHGWSITSKGQEYETKDGDVYEQTVSSFEVYSDKKRKNIHVAGSDVGAVLGFEYERKARPYILQDFWAFQSIVPVEQSRYELHLAPGWRFKADWINHEEKKPSEENGAIIWQINEVPRVEREPRQPPYAALAARMVVTFLSDKVPSKSYRDWSEFGSWYKKLAARVREHSPAVQQKVQELAPGNLPMLERIKALARFAQHDVRYVEISIGVSGWRPHAAPDELTHRYADCK